MKLLVIRHARAAESRGEPDSQRPLTKLGRSEFSAAAQKIVRDNSAPQHVFHSPALRTTQTAELLVLAAGLPNHACDVAPWLALGIGCEQILPMLISLPTEVTALVGHEPNMSALASQLLGGGWLTFRPGTIACIEFEGAVQIGAGKLLWLLDAATFAE